MKTGKKAANNTQSTLKVTKTIFFIKITTDKNTSHYSTK